MTSSDKRLSAGGLLAVLVPGLLLHFAADTARLQAGLTAAPFGWPRVLAVHLLATLPLTFLLARRLRTIPAVNEAAAGLWVLVGAGAAGLATVIAPGLGEGVASGE
ncbi:MAG: hypothetical protein K2V38_08840, partial [Gemmataceae bacterium]|nr:hypothetical protein [Gemmataceae bacterium]